MSVVQLGTNQFEKCRVLIGYGDEPLLAVKTGPLRLTLNVPPTPAYSGRRHVEDGIVQAAPDLLVVKSSDEFSAVFFLERLVLFGVCRSEYEVHLRIDLRPFGLTIFDDIDGLHIGTNVFAMNHVANADVAIALA